MGHFAKTRKVTLPNQSAGKLLTLGHATIDPSANFTLTETDKEVVTEKQTVQQA